MPILVIAGVVVCVALLARWRAQYVAHRRRVDALRWRVNVDGTRQATTATRFIAGMFREAGLTTIAMTAEKTGAVVITEQGLDEPIDRTPEILDQVEAIERYVSPHVDALVVECPAGQPRHRELSERMVVRSNIGVLTDVGTRESNDVTAPTAGSLAACPTNGVLVTSEQDPGVLDAIRGVCVSKGSELVVVDAGQVSVEEIRRFGDPSVGGIVAIALAIASVVGIDRAVAIRGMVKVDRERRAEQSAARAASRVAAPAHDELPSRSALPRRGTSPSTDRTGIPPTTTAAEPALPRRGG